MPRRLLKKLTPHPGTLQNRWYLRVFGSRLSDPSLWSLQRRSVTSAFGAGLAICFVPLPIHLPLAALTAMAWRLNVPTIVATVFLVNPLTVVPIYYVAYRIGAAIMGTPNMRFAFSLSWDWLQRGLGPIWKPFLVGCLVCALGVGFAGRWGFELLWRWRVRTKYRNRKATSTS